MLKSDRRQRFPAVEALPHGDGLSRFRVRQMAARFEIGVFLARSTGEKPDFHCRPPPKVPFERLFAALRSWTNENSQAGESSRCVVRKDFAISPCKHAVST